MRRVYMRLVVSSSAVPCSLLVLVALMACGKDEATDSGNFMCPVED